MRHLTFLILLILAWPQLAYSYDVLVLLSRRDAAYEEAVGGFHQKYRFKERVVVLSNYADIDITRMLREDDPRVVLAVGDRALAIARKSRIAPVVSLMALALGRKGASPFVTGVEFYVKPDQIAQLFHGIKAQRVGVVFDPGKSGEYFRKVQAAASKNGVSLVAREVASTKDAIQALSTLKGNVDAVWMVPDSTAVNRQTLEAYFLFSLGQQVPLVTFDRSHLVNGAAVAIEPDRAEMGRQASEMVAAILDGTLESFSSVAPRKIIVKTGSSPSVMNLLRVNPGALERLSTTWK